MAYPKISRITASTVLMGVIRNAHKHESPRRVYKPRPQRIKSGSYWDRLYGKKYEL